MHIAGSAPDSACLYHLSMGLFRSAFRVALHLLAGCILSLLVALACAARVSDDVLLDLRPIDAANAEFPRFLSNWPAPSRVGRSRSVCATILESHSTRGWGGPFRPPHIPGEMRCIYRQERFGFPARCLEHRTFLMQSGDRAAMKSELNRVREVFGWRGGWMMPAWMHTNVQAGPRFIPMFIEPSGLLVNACFWSVVLWMFISGSRSAMRRWRLRRGRCPSCGYQLAGISVDQCPECGGPVARSEEHEKGLARARP